ncbi:hypothetical protein [Falsiroseomonas sp. E2-1-a20]|uniref:hypothetical protein n=1 Tax=Falsiroseomonas sp. E2-1-a20 TaxID=3239300 RepID=UPI003F2E8EF5
MNPCFTINDTARLAELAVKLQQSGAAHPLPLIRAAMAKELAFVMVAPGGRIPLRVLDPMKHPLPVVVVLGGDHAEPAGPDDFPQTRRLLRWSRATMLHGAGGEELHYAAAVSAARAVGRVLIAETCSVHLADWIALAKAVAPHVATLVIAPKPGTSHPYEAAPAGVVLQ